MSNLRLQSLIFYILFCRNSLKYKVGDSDDNPFDLKVLARKFKTKRESIIHTGRLIDIDSPITSGPLTDWERLEQEAKAIAGQLGQVESKINFDEVLEKSHLNSSQNGQKPENANF